ncbi:MAG: hypothetical protein ACERKS_13155, partial [Candidatus Bathyarchaeota archaeon]
MKTDKETGFYITYGKGFHITFENGWTVSVQFGPHNYCDNKVDLLSKGIEPTQEECGREGCANAEVAVWGPDGGMLPFEIPGGDTVKG